LNYGEMGLRRIRRYSPLHSFHLLTLHGTFDWMLGKGPATLRGT